MHTCSNKIQKRIIEAMDNYLLDADNPTFLDLEEYIAEELGRKTFSFKEVSDNVPIITKLKDIFGEDIDLSSDRSILHYSNILRDVRSYSIDDLFHGIPAAKVEFDGYVKRVVIGDGVLGKNNDDTYAVNDEQLNNNFTRIKSDLFNKIQKFLISKNLYHGDVLPLYNEEGIANYDSYVNIMTIINDYFFNNPEIPIIKSYTNKKIPNLSVSDANKPILEAYYNMILLSNFDTVISTKFKNFFKVNLNKFNLLDSGFGENLKYYLKFDPITTPYWRNDNHQAESSEDRTDEFTRNVVSIIPLYNKQGIKTKEYLEVNDLYLIAAKVSEFELLEGNKLKNHNTNFDYFNTNPVEKLKWYLENIGRAINRESGSIQELVRHFDSIYDKILSIDKFINNSEYNIAKKEANSGNSILGYIAQAINNNYGAAYSSYDARGKYSIQEMYNQDFNSTRVQSTVFSTLKMHYADKDFYNISDDFEALFPKNLDAIDNVLHSIESGEIDYNKLNKYITSKTGIAMSKQSLINTVKDISIHNKNGDPVNGVEFKSMFKELMLNLKADFNSDTFREAVALSNDRSVRLDSTVGEYLSNTVKNPLFIALKNSFIDKFTVKVVMNANTANGDTIPSFKIGNLTYKDTQLFDLRRQYERENPNGFFKSLLLKDSPAILGTLTKLEVVRKGRAKDYSKLTPEEQFISDFNYDFLKSLNNSGKFSVILGNYSDKTTILAKIINGNFKLTDNGKPVISESIDTILETVRVQSFSYYSDLLDSIFSDYKNIFDILGIKNNIDLNWKTNNKLEDNVKNINDILKVNSISSINDRLADISPDKRPNLLMQELHYSKYSNGTFLNNLILDNYLIFSDSSKDGLFYNMFVPRTESSFITKFSKFSNPNSLHINNGEVDDYLRLLNINREDFKVENNNKSTYEYNSLLINNKLNPFVKKWLWLNSLFRNEYLYIGVKGEYMHPHKSNIFFRFGSNDKNYWDNYFLEMSKRMIPLGKRNVTYTASIESPIRNSKRGVPDKINVAAIEDYKSNIYTTSGYKKIGADSHDGSSFLDYVYSKMVDESFPGKGYSGTKKQFATFVTPYGVTIKKDAESVITNAKILASGNSDINLLQMKYKMLNIPIGDIRLTYNSGSLANYYIIRNGVRLRVNSIKINNDADGNYISINYSKGIEKDGQIIYTGSIDTKEYIDTLYDIWNHIGAQYSIDVNGNFNEESNERLYDIVINTNNGILKTKMIHILSNVSALKAGATGVNSASRWKSWDSLLYSTYNSRFMGPQLDASHEADQSEIREVSQVISALSQGGFTADIADEAYRDIANVIAKSMDRYLKHMKVDNVDKEALYNMLSAKFIRSIQKSDRDEVTKDLINALLDNGVPVPFSNQNFYNLYVREIITTLNNDFISRNYPGIGGVLIPSHGMIQLYDVFDGNKWTTITQEDIIKEALSIPTDNEKVPANSINLYDTVVIGGIELSVDTEQRLNWLKNTYGDRIVEKVPRQSNEAIVNDFINKNLQDVLLDSRYIELGDTIRIDGEVITLDTPAKYYSFKENGPSTVYRVLSKPRDLKPTLHTFKEVQPFFDLVSNSETFINVPKNTFDIQPLALLYKYTENILNDKDKIIINNIKNYIGNEDIVKFLRAWYQRDLQLLDHGLIMKELKETDNVSEYFKNDNVLDDIVQDVLPYYQNNANKIVDLKFRPAEIMMPDIYKSTFNRDDNDSLYRIKKEGPKYFKNKFDILYDIDDTEADIKIVTSDVSNPIYIRFVTELSGFNSVNIKKNPDVDYELYSRYNEVGDRLYDLVDYKNTRVILENGKEIIEYKVGYTDKKGKNILRRNAFNAVEKLIKSFTDIKAIVPLNNGNITSAYYNNRVSKLEMADMSEQEIKNIKNDDSLDLVNIYFNISNIFSKYNGISLAGIDVTDKNWFSSNKELILNRLANSIYASWEKSHDVVASRIPSQSMQSFMPMRNVGYIKGNTNDVYVSVHQIFLQGSDFDVDKAYILGHGFLNNGRTDLWTNLSSYSTVDQLNALMQLPMPSGKIINIIEGNGDPNLEILYNQIANSLANVSYEYELPTETILLFNKFIRALPTTNLDVLPINISQENPNLPFSEFERLLNKHTTYTNYSTSPYSVKNSIVQKINKVISSASNQINANTPVDVQPLHDAIDRVKNKRNKQIPTINNKKVQTILHNSDYDSDLGKGKKGYEQFRIYKADEGQTAYSLAYGKPVKIKGFEELNFYISQDWDGGPWTTYEKRTGKITSHGNTQKEAIENLQERLNSVGLDSMRNIISKQESVYEENQVEEFNTEEVENISDEDNLNSHDMLSYYQQQYDASVGKDNTGIAANGVKGLFALTAYYNNFFLNTWGNRDLTDTELRRSSKLFKKDIKFKDDFGNDVRIFIGSLPDVLINRKQEESLKRVLGDNYSRLFPNSAVYMSAFVSAATDNAKELIMAKVNASPKLAGMHAYMIALGFTPDQITEFMTSKTASKIVLRSTDNIYDNELSNSVTKVIRELKSDSTVDQSQLSAFEQLYLDSQEFANLTSILGVNQKLKARTWEMYNFLSRFDNILRSAENLVISDFKNLDKPKFIDAILKYNNLLTPEDIGYIGQIYDAVNSLTLENGKTVKILHNFNSNYYFNSPRYRQYVKEYYNLIKRTFNIFEVVDEVPHFKKLIESLDMSDNVLKDTAEKYNFTLNTLKNVLNDESHELSENDVPRRVAISNLTKGSNYFDTKAALLWLKTDKMSKYIFDVGNILKQAGMNKITLYKDSDSKYNLETITVTQEDNYIVDLTTDYGIANFKKLMEEAVLPLLQQLDNSNVIKNLRVETITNQYGLKTNAIVSAYELKRLNSSIAIEQFNQLIDAFNNIDRNVLTANKIQNAYGEPLQWRDLFYIYNLVVNNERYGNKRLTPLFRDYTKSFDSLSLDYMKFFSKIDKGDIDVLYDDLYNSPEYINADEDTRKSLKEKYDKTIKEDLLFYSFNERGVLSELEDSPEVKAQIANPDFVLTWNITGKYDTSYYKMNSLLRKINLGGFIVEFNC